MVIGSLLYVMMMKTIRISDNTRQTKDHFSDISVLTERIRDKTIGQLEKSGIFVFPEYISESPDLTEEQIVLQSVNDTYQTSNVMGFLGCGNERLVIQSRFSDGDQDYFFQYLLERVLDFPNMTNMISDASPDNRLFNFLLFLFPRYLRSAMRKGLFKEYIHNRYNDPNVKGSIDIARHIRSNTPFTGRIAYSQREFSYDNDLMELIRHTVEYIKRKPYGNKILGKAKEEIQLVIQATPRYEPYDLQQVIERNRRNPVRHAYYCEYRALQKLCLLILRNEKHQIGSGSNQVFGILFDGAWLWEEYLDLLVNKIFYHPMNKSGRGAQRLFNRNAGLIYPDFISRNSESRMIADAKYKPIGNIGNRDYLQLLAYMFRFDARTGFYLYPEASGSEDLHLCLNQGSTYEKNVTPRENIRIIKHGLKIPDNVSDYSEFVEKMRGSEGTCISIFS